MFDPLAVLLLIASQYTFEYYRRKDDGGERLRRERAEYERLRAEKIADNPGFTVDSPTPPEEEEVDERVDQPTDSNIQDGDVEPDERDGEANDENSVYERETVEEDQEQVSNSELKFLKKDIETETPAGFKVDNSLLDVEPPQETVQKDEELEQLLSKADPETLEEVAKELDKEEPISRARDLTVDDKDLSSEELLRRIELFPENYENISTEDIDLEKVNNMNLGQTERKSLD